MNFPPPSRPFDDFDAAFEAAGVDTQPEEPVNPTGDAKSELSVEEMMMEQFLNDLIEAKQNSLTYQKNQYDANTAQKQEADMLERKLGR